MLPRPLARMDPNYRSLSTLPCFSAVAIAWRYLAAHRDPDPIRGPLFFSGLAGGRGASLAVNGKSCWSLLVAHGHSQRRLVIVSCSAMTVLSLAHPAPRPYSATEE